MAQLSGVSPTSSTAHRDDGLDETSEPKHRVFLSHSGAQKPFVEHLCVELERYYRHPFFDKRWESLPIGENFPHHIFTAVQQCHVGVVILSDDFLTSKWPMMELVAMHDRVLEETKSGKSIFKIMPIFLGISILDLDDPKNWERWLRHWHELARLNPTRVSVEKWEASLKYLRSINGLVYDGLSELRFQKEIVDVICRAVPIEMRLEDSYIEGKSRLCKVIVDKINEEQKSNDSAVCVVGLYGMGGVGKTSICKALCNEFFIKFRGKTSHAELERGSDHELLREVLKNLTDISREHLDGLNGDKLQNELTKGIKDPVFLALDNMTDTDASLKEAKSYLSARLPRGSIIIVTARSKELLMRLRSYINENQCLEMPELLHEEAKSLFIKAADFEVGNEVDEQLMLRCVERCRFSKHDTNASHHYHPLALDVLGRQLGCIDPKEWASQLDMIDDDIFNQLRENDHPIFSILRKSFDRLSPEDQQLFLDVALFNPRHVSHGVLECTRFEWLRMVHSIPSIADVLTRLRKLKTKSLLERLEDESNPTIGMHDLWRAFCIAETNHGGLRRQRWVYESKNRSEIVETSPSGTCWENVKRMAFIDDLVKKLGRVNFSHFPNVTVLKIVGTLTSEMLVLDLSGLIHLKSLHVRTRAQGNIVTQGLPRSLVYLHWHVEGMDCDAPQLLEQIAFLEQLECLRFIDYGGFELPDVSSMVSLRWATFRNCENAVTVTGLSSKLTKLQWLNFEGCSELRSCSGVDDLVALKMLDFTGCHRLKLPNLRKLRNLRTLCITECLSINEVPGLGDLVALEEFYAASIPDLSELPDMSKLINLKKLYLSRCFNLRAVPGFDRLISLEDFDVYCKVETWPNLQQLTRLKSICISGWNIAGLRGLVDFAMLHTLVMTDCSGVDELPDLRSLISLERFSVDCCEFKSLSGLSNSSMLMSLWIRGCGKLERIPDLRRLTRLNLLSIRECGAVPGCWNCAFGQAEEDSWRSDDSNIRSGLPNSQRLTELQQSFSEGCGVVHVTVIGAFSQLESLHFQSLQVAELPDLRIFPRLKILWVDNCGSLTKFTSGEITNASLEPRLPRPSSLTTLPELGSSSGLSKRDLDAWDGITVLKDSGPVMTGLTSSNCNALQVIPDLGMFLALEYLDLQGCGGLTTLGSSMLLPALQSLNLNGCSALESLPDLGMFPALEELLLHGCCRLTTLSSSVPLTALKPLDIGSCSGLESLPDMGMFPSLRRLIIDGLSGLTTLSSSVALPALHCISLPNCSSLKALPDMRMFSALYTLRLDGCRELAKLSTSVPLPILHELSLRNCAGLEALPDLGLFPVLEKLVLSGCCGLKTLYSSLPVPALRHLNIDSCSGLEALPDLAYFPALEELLLNGCWELTTLSSSVSLPVLKWLDVRRCWSLSGDDLEQLRGLCPQCEVRYDVIKDYVALGDECVEKHRRSRMLKCLRR